MIAILPGLIAGFAHVFSGPDHLAALAPWSIEQRGRAWRTGFRWGLGHAGSVLVLGLLSLWLREVLPLDWLSSWAERLVGLALAGIGIWGFRKASARRLHIHEHTHDGWTHTHIHAHGSATAHICNEVAPHSHTHAAFGVGILHGVAGTSHSLGVLPALAFPTGVEAFCYLAAFATGTMLAMAGFTFVVGLLARELAPVTAKAYRALMLGCSTAAVVLGVYWLVF